MKVADQFIAYFRVSTAEKGGSGLGIEAQQEKVRQLVAAKGGELIAEFREQRYTVGNGDLFQYFVAVGVPVYGSAGDLIGAISVGDIAQKYPPERIQEVGRILVEITSQY